MDNSLQRRMRSRRGQGMTEYIIIVALVAVAAIGVIAVFGDNIRALFGASTDALAGRDTASVDTKVSGEKAKHRSIKDFAQDNGSK
jgi:pilus assembly protein Flp/PilA